MGHLPRAYRITRSHDRAKKYLKGGFGPIVASVSRAANVQAGSLSTILKLSATSQTSATQRALSSIPVTTHQQCLTSEEQAKTGVTPDFVRLFRRHRRHRRHHRRSQPGSRIQLVIAYILRTLQRDDHCGNLRWQSRRNDPDWKGLFLKPVRGGGAVTARS